jgi:hypothetical protein
LAGTSSSGVFLTTNNGTNWTEVNNGLTNTSIQAFAASGANLFTGTYNGGVFLTTNNGTNWTEVNNGLTNTNVLALAVTGANLFAGTRLGVFVSANNGTSWSEVSSGLTNTYVISLAVSGTNLFAGTWGSGVWRRPLSELVSVRIISSDLPTEFGLRQNYPNPFNPATKIRFTLPKRSFAKLVIYDALGRELETIVNEQLNAGTYEVDWSGDKFSSGVYYCKLSSADFVVTKKMVLLK